MRKLIEAKIANTETLKGLIARRCLNTRLQLKGFKVLHPTSTRFLQIVLQEPTYDCNWRDDVHNRPTFFDIGEPMSRQSMEKDCLLGYRTGTINAFTRSKAEAAI